MKKDAQNKISPKVSIITPIYNCDRFLPKCIDTILGQSIRDFELILIDDGSTDHSAKICNDYVLNHDNVFYVHQDNKGVSAARNLGIKKARGKYIAFVDADDWLEKDYLEILLENMSENGLAACKLVINDESVDRSGHSMILNLEEAQLSIFSGNGMQGFPVTKLFERKILIENSVFFEEDIGICEDVLFCIQYSRYVSGEIKLSEKTPYHYRKMSTGATNGRYKKGVELSDKQISEFIAIKRCQKYLIDSPVVLSAWKARMVKGAVTDLRAIVASESEYDEKYRVRMDYVKKNALRYFFNRVGTWSAKLSVVLSLLSPKLECAVWRIINKREKA